MFGMTSLTREKVMGIFVTYSIICSYCSGAKIWRDTWGYDFASFMPGDDSGTRGAEDECWLNCLQAGYIQHSHWSSFYIAALSLVESSRVLKYFHALKGPIIGALSDATPAVLCHKEPARRKNTPY